MDSDDEMAAPDPFKEETVLGEGNEAYRIFDQLGDVPTAQGAFPTAQGEGGAAYPARCALLTLLSPPLRFRWLLRWPSPRQQDPPPTLGHCSGPPSSQLGPFLAVNRPYGTRKRSFASGILAAALSRPSARSSSALKRLFMYAPCHSSTLRSGCTWQ